MAIVGCFGTLIFECSRRKLHSFHDLKVSNEGRYAQHDVHNQLPILEFVGPGLSEVTFEMNFNLQYGSDPFVSLSILRLYTRSGLVAPLLVGHRPIVVGGFNLWVVTKLGEDHKWFKRDGRLQGASVDVNLKEYRMMI